MENQHLPAVGAPPAGLPTPDYTTRPYAPPEGFDPGEGAGGKVNLQRYVSAVLRYRWLVLLLFVLGAVGGVFASRFVRPEYTAEATFWFDVSSQGDQARGPIQPGELLQSEAWVSLLRSFAVLDPVVRDQRLYLQHDPADRQLFAAFALDTAFQPGQYRWKVGRDGRTAELLMRDGTLVETVQRGAPAGVRVGFRWTPDPASYVSGREADFTLMMPRDASKQLSETMDPRLAVGGNFLSLSYSGKDPEQVASVVNAVADQYIRVAAGLKSAKLMELREILETQLGYAQQNLATAEMQLENFTVQTITLPSQAAAPVAAGLEVTRDPVMTAYFNMKFEREANIRDRDAILRAIAAPDSVSVDALSAVQAVQQSPEFTRALTELATKRAELRSLSQQYTAEHPSVIRARADIDDLEKRAIPQLGRRLGTELDTRVQTLDSMVGSASQELRQIPPRAIEEARHRRSVEIAATLYNDLRQRFEGARLAAEAAVPDVRVLDRATVPSRPNSNPHLTMILMGLAIGLALGLAAAVLLDRVDPRLRYVEQITQDMRLPIMGAVPSLRAARKGLLDAESTSRVLESLRAVRLNLMYAYGSAGPIVVTITSPGPGDGKTFVASNLALTFADLGMRTLIVDGDTRRGMMHHMMSVDRKPGLTDFLAGDCAFDAALRKTSYPLIDLLPCGTRRPDSPELLSSPNMGDLMARAKAEYRVILIDSPPLGAGVDPLILGTLAGHMLLVMRTGKTDRAVAESKLQMLDRLPVRVLGVIMNGYDQGDSYRYYSYLSGYEAQDEDAPTALLQPS